MTQIKVDYHTCVSEIGNVSGKWFISHCHNDNKPCGFRICR